MRIRSFDRVLILGLTIGIACCSQPGESRAAGSLTVAAGYDLFASGPGTTFPGLGPLVGVPLGIFAGYRGAKAEMLIMRGTDMLMAFPTLLLALIIVTALGGTLANEIMAIGIALTPNFVRLARSLTLTIREQDYIMAARAIGANQLRVMATHVFPNALYAFVVVATLYIATAIRTEASLSFLGLGIPPPTPSWGNILSEGRQYIKCCPWITTFSGLAIMVAVLAFNLVGDALRDLLDPRLKGE